MSASFLFLDFGRRFKFFGSRLYCTVIGIHSSQSLSSSNISPTYSVVVVGNRKFQLFRVEAQSDVQSIASPGCPRGDI